MVKGNPVPLFLHPSAAADHVERLAAEHVNVPLIGVQAHLVVEDEAGPAHGRRVVRDLGPLAGADVVHEEVALDVAELVAHAALQVPAKHEDLPVVIIMIITVVIIIIIIIIIITCR